MGPEETWMWQWKGNIRIPMVMELFCVFTDVDRSVSTSRLWCYTLILQDGTMRRKFVMDTWVPSVLFLTTVWESQNKFNDKKKNTAWQGTDETTAAAEMFMVIEFIMIISFSSLVWKFPQPKDLLKFTKVNLESLCRVVVSSGFPVLSSVVQNPIPLGHPTYSC